LQPILFWLQAEMVPLGVAHKIEPPRLRPGRVRLRARR
jgi:hypothetical protein